MAQQGTCDGTVAAQVIRRITRHRVYFEAPVLFVTVDLEIPPGKVQSNLPGAGNHQIAYALRQLKDLEIIHHPAAAIVDRVREETLSEDIVADDMNPGITSGYHTLEMDRPAFRGKPFEIGFGNLDGLRTGAANGLRHRRTIARKPAQLFDVAPGNTLWHAKPEFLQDRLVQRL